MYTPMIDADGFRTRSGRTGSSQERRNFRLSTLVGNVGTKCRKMHRSCDKMRALNSNQTKQTCQHAGDLRPSRKIRLRLPMMLYHI